MVFIHFLWGGNIVGQVPEPGWLCTYIRKLPAQGTIRSAASQHDRSRPWLPQCRAREFFADNCEWPTLTCDQPEKCDARAEVFILRRFL